MRKLGNRDMEKQGTVNKSTRAQRLVGLVSLPVTGSSLGQLPSALDYGSEVVCRDGLASCLYILSQLGGSNSVVIDLEAIDLQSHF